jgi:hypothetical protein
MFLAFKKRITERISHAAGFSIFLNNLNTQDDAKTRFDCLQIAYVPSQMTNKLCTHAHRRDRSAVSAIFADGTYFVDTPRMKQEEANSSTSVLRNRPRTVSVTYFRICIFI